MEHVVRAPWDMLRGSMGHVARAPWDMLQGLHGTCCEGSMGHAARLHGTCCEAPWDMLRELHGTCCKGSMEHVVRAPWDMLRGSMGHVARAPWNMSSMGYVARAPWDMLQGLHGTFHDSKLVTRLYIVPRLFLVQWLNGNIETPEEIMIYVGLSAMLHGTYCTNPWDMLRGLHGPCWAPLDML